MSKMPSKIKVLFVITKSNFGGAQKYVYDLATGLQKDRFETAVALGGSGQLIQKLHEQRVRVIPIFSLTRDINALSDLFAFFELWSIIRLEKPVVVHLNSAKASGLGALAARLAGVPKIIFTAHGWAFNEDRPFLQRIVIKFFSWITVMLSHKTIAVSEAVRNDTRNWLFIRNKIVTIHNGIDSAELLTSEEALSHLFTQAGAQIPKDAIVLGSIAELHKNKGLRYAIEAIAILIKKNPSVFYLILGNGEENEQLDALIKRHKLQEHIFLLGFVENAATYLKAFDIFVLPSIKEGLPYVLLEAGLAGLPVVASRVGGIPEIIEDGKTGLLVSPRDSSAISSAIEKLSESLELRTKLGKALREKVIHDFSLSRVVSETISLYENI
ncbi:MAG: glycosyltransferase family 4 protein [Patescibacteria group bacterium]